MDIELKNIVSLISNDLIEFENNLKNIVLSTNNFLKDDLYNFIFHNPKRLRPIFVFLFSKILNINNSDFVQKIALALELIHSASLVHDDIIDCEIIRRNNLTFYNKFGSKIALLEGDLLLSLALEILSETNIDIVKIFSKKIKNTILGEIEQDENLNKLISKDKYLKKTYSKTANLFLCGIEALFSLKNIELDTKTNIKEFIENFALAFQIKNDIDNFISNKSDVKNGNYTLCMIYLLMDYNVKDIEDIKNISDDEIEKYANYAYTTVDKYKQRALNIIEKIDNKIYKDALIKVLEYSLRSKFC